VFGAPRTSDTVADIDGALDGDFEALDGVIERSGTSKALEGDFDACLTGLEFMNGPWETTGS
jgi:hypothetical protein